MSEFMAKKLAGRMAWVSICAVGLTGLIGCQDSATGPKIELQPMTTTDVNIILPDDYAEPGEEVEVMFQLLEIEGDGNVVLEGTVTWNPASFEFVDTAPLGSVQILDSDFESGRMRVRRDLGPLEDGWIVVIFVALRGAETSGFTADAQTHLMPLDH